MWQKTIILPKTFVFKDESLKTTIGILARLNNLRRKEIYIDFSRVEQIRKSDLMVLMAQLEKMTIEKKSVKVKGKIPKNISDLFDEFYEKDTHEKITHLNLVPTMKNAIYARDINPSIVENTVQDLNRLGVNNDSHGYGFYERIKALLTEIIGNAVEHGIKNRNINYWLASKVKNNQQVVTFVDMGKGIAYSHKKSKLPLYYRITGLFSDNKIVMDSLLGKLRSSTRDPFRGKGLPEIREIIEKEFVSEFVLITNKTLIQYRKNKFTTSKIANFKGTYYCWTISKQNFEKWKISQSTLPQISVRISADGL